MRAICYQSFPPEELDDFDDWLSQIAQAKRWLYLAEKEHTLLGIATILPQVARGVHLLETLAVGRAYRNQNIGSQLLQYAVKSLCALGDASGIILEVESDEYGENRALRARRIAFYERNGAGLVSCAGNFRTPNAAGGEPLHSKLMWIPLSDNAKSLRGRKLRECVRGILTLDYDLAANDRLVQENLKDLTC